MAGHGFFCSLVMISFVSSGPTKIKLVGLLTDASMLISTFESGVYRTTRSPSHFVSYTPPSESTGNPLGAQSVSSAKICCSVTFSPSNSGE